MPERLDPQQLAWSIFWQADHFEACVPRVVPEALDNLHRHWRQFVTSLGNGSRLLDLGTGNGALALLALRAARQAGLELEVHGVDSALIDPPRYLPAMATELRAIRFHSGVAMEQLPFADQHFDAVVGQYALEYSDTARSVPEWLRVLRVGGTFRFLLHSEEAVLKGQSCLQREQAERILESPLFSQMRAMLPAIYAAQAAEATAGANSAQPLARAQQRMTEFAATLSSLQESFAHMADLSLPERVLQAARALPTLRQELSETDLLQRVGDIETLLRAQALRLRDMEGAALSVAGRQQLLQHCSAAGATDLILEEARSESSLLGCWLSGRR